MKGDPSPRLIIDILLLICLRGRGSFEVGCVVLSARCRVLIGRQIGALSKGFLVGRSTAGHLILLECGQALAGPHSRCQISISCRCSSSSSSSSGGSSCPSAAAYLGYIFTKNNKAVGMTSSPAAGEGCDSSVSGWVGGWGWASHQKNQFRPRAQTEHYSM